MTRILTLRQLVATALEETLGTEAAIQLGDSLSTSLVKHMRRNRLALHNTGLCRALTETELGRPMTPEEMKMVGMDAR